MKIKKRIRFLLFMCMMIIGIVQIDDFTVNAAYEHHMQCQLSQYTISANLTEMNGLPRGLSGYKNNVNQTLYLNMAAGSAVYLKRIVLTVDGRSEYDHTYNNYGRWVTYPFSSKKYGVGTHTAKWTLYDVNGSVYNISNTWKVVEKTYTISFHANGGSNAPASQTKYYGKTLVLSNSIPSRAGYTFLGWSENSNASSATYSAGGYFTANANSTLYAVWKKNTYNYTICFDANGGTGAPGMIIKSGTDSSVGMGDITSIVPNRNGYTFYGWSASPNWSAKRIAYSALSGVANAPDGTIAQMTSNSWTFSDYCNKTGGTISNRTLRLYAQWAQESQTPISTCTVTLKTNSFTYNGSEKKPDVTVKYGNTILVNGTDYSVSYSNNINAGTAIVTINGKGKYLGTASKTFTIAKAAPTLSFASSNIRKKVNDTAFVNGLTKTTDGSITYTSNNTNVAVVNNSGYVTLMAEGTAVIKANAASGRNYNAGSTSYTLTVVAGSQTNIYNLGEETYSFANYSDSDSPGHCFGMSATSSGYYIGNLKPFEIGILSSDKLFKTKFSNKKAIKKICDYQQIQGSYSRGSIVAGGSYYRTYTSNIQSDWKSVVSYVKNHSFDGTGRLQIGFRAGNTGHAINFLYYKNVNGQDRIYAYDNNFPNIETYFYMDNQGKVQQAPKQTLDPKQYGPIYTITLRDMKKYFLLASEYEKERAIYAKENMISIPNVKGKEMEGSSYLMYELSESTEEVIIIPLKDNAEFCYMGKELSFDDVSLDTYAKLNLADPDENNYEYGKQFEIYDNGREKVDTCYKGHTYGKAITTINPTCTDKGIKIYKCTVCGDTSKKKSIPALGHKYSKTVTRATLKNSGAIVNKCTVCGYQSKKSIAYPKEFIMSADKLAYSGKVQKPKLSVRDSAGKIIDAKNYSVSYSNKNSKDIRKYSITITFKGNYTGTKKLSYMIVPKGTSLIKVSSAKQAFSVAWKKQTTQTTGYQIQYSTDKKFKNSKTLTIKGNQITSKKISKLKSKTKYYIRVRTFKSIKGTIYGSTWSGVKTVIIK